MSISLCIIIKNEANIIESFLSHHRPLVDEIIIIDTGSTDKTIEFAKRFTTKIYSEKWKNDFSLARNMSISKATKDWILWLDPDERIDEADFKKIKELTEDTSSLGYSFIQKTYTNVTLHPRFKPEKSNFEGSYTRRITKLFQNNKNIQFQYPVHETVINSIKKMGKEIKETKIVIEHFPEAKNKEFLIEKQNMYLALLEEKKTKYKDSNADKEIKTEKTILEYYTKK